MAPILSCAIYAKLVYVAFLYNTVTNVSMPLFENRLSSACLPADLIACAFNTLNVTGETGDMLQYHYAFGIHYTFVGINDPQCAFSTSPMHLLPDCVRDLIVGSYAPETCGYIVNDTTTGDDDKAVRDVTVVNFDESRVLSMTHVFASSAGESSSGYGSQNNGNRAGMTIVVKLLIVLIFITSVMLGAFATKWIIACVMNNNKRSTDATRYLS